MHPTRVATRSSHRPTARAEAIAIALFLAFTTVALIGYAVFGRNPARLAMIPAGLRPFYGVSFGFFAQAQIVVGAVVLLLILHGRAGWRWVSALVLVYGISLASELGGTRFGIPFGAYTYGALLGPRWLGLVPVLIPLSWFLMAVPSYALARHLAGGGGAIGRVAAASLILLAWDLSLDPAMSHAVRYWEWADAGPYYGMPLVNLAGWYVTGLALMLALQAVRAGEWLDRIPARLMAAYWGVTLLMPLGMNSAAGLTGAVLAGLAPILVLGAAALVRARSAVGSGVAASVARDATTGAGV
jgi:putative membrane protein